MLGPDERARALSVGHIHVSPCSTMRPKIISNQMVWFRLHLPAVAVCSAHTYFASAEAPCTLAHILCELSLHQIDANKRRESLIYILRTLIKSITIKILCGECIVYAPSIVREAKAHTNQPTKKKPANIFT